MQGSGGGGGGGDVAGGDSVRAISGWAGGVAGGVLIRQDVPGSCGSELDRVESMDKVRKWCVLLQRPTVSLEAERLLR